MATTYTWTFKNLVIVNKKKKNQNSTVTPYLVLSQYYDNDNFHFFILYVFLYSLKNFSQNKPTWSHNMDTD